MDTRILDLPDGRELAWTEAGDPAGSPVFAFHGTPGSRHQLLVDDAPMLAAGVRFIAPDRPGYGLSTFRPRRTLRDWASDVAALADHLGIDRFAVLGLSGGGPHSAACARFLADRVTAAAIVSGVAPVSEPGSEQGMMTMNQVLTRVARRAPIFTRLPFGVMARICRRFPDKAIESAKRRVPAPDAAVLSRPLVAAAFRRDFAHSSATAGKAATQDFTLFTRDWGFRLEDITIPVHVWQGDADINVPPAHASLQADRIPGAVLHMFPGEGHLMCVDHMEDILRALTAAAPHAAASA
jgi:pimeloyl-ACP methyl ester carboxylesterase